MLRRRLEAEPAGIELVGGGRFEDELAALLQQRAVVTHQCRKRTDRSEQVVALTPAGIATRTLDTWLTGANLAGCSTNGNLWTCDLTTSTGKQARIVWVKKTAVSKTRWTVRFFNYAKRSDCSI